MLSHFTLLLRVSVYVVEVFEKGGLKRDETGPYVEDFTYYRDFISLDVLFAKDHLK